MRVHVARLAALEQWEIDQINEIIDHLDAESSRTSDAYTRGVMEGIVFRLGLLIEAKKEKTATVAPVTA